MHLFAAGQKAFVMDPRTRMLLEAPVGPTILRLALPNVVVMVVQSSIGLIETYFVAKLGTDALAGMALVFPLFMVMQMVSAGAMGGGILSAVARALGSGKRDGANELVWYAVAITVALGALTTAAALLFGPKLYALMGGRDGSLAAASTYSKLVFAGAIPLWLFNSFAAVIRGTGNMIFPAAVITAPARLFLIPLSPLLIFGLGPLPQLGIAGGAAAVVLYYVVGCAIFASYIWSGRGVLKPSLVPPRLAWAPTRDILRVGAVSSVVSLSTNVSIATATGLAGPDRPCRRRRLRHRRAARISAGAAGVRPRRAGGRHGRHLHRRRPPRSRPAGRMDRRGDCRRPHRGDRACGRVVSAGLAVVVRQRSDHDRGRRALSAHRRSVLRLLRRRARAVFRVAGRGPGRAGR